ncbi:MAG TPA: phenylalanine--tRNA ligase subunit beta [Thermoanaerobaculia bacterium]|nr:phenylalanine--tRNA ligase subunit beta [Thermoanaerobaculia bacterium]
MKFSLSWLADYLDLPLGGALRSDAAGRRWLGDLDGEIRRKSVQIGEELTAAGLAVEAIDEVPAGKGGPDLILDVDVTSNRPDCMNHQGLARELAVALGVPLTRPPISFFGSISSEGADGAVRLEDPEGCPRFVSRVIRGVKVGPSPDWLVRRLASIGLRSINNVVDATNFVLWETGQPLHAYDLATVPGGELRVRRARAGEKLVTLDEVERELGPEILVIADRERAVGVAGVMGGFDTEVTAKTSDVLLESAHFDRRRIRTGAKLLGLHTDASHRFERGADFGACDEASRRCAALIVEIAGGAVEEGAVDAIAARPATIEWRLEADRLERFAGFPVSDEEIEATLGGLGFEPGMTTGERSWSGSVPSWRAVDFEPRRDRAAESGAPLAYPQDVYEEVLRHVGLDRVPSTLPGLGGVDPGVNPMHETERRARRALAGLGFAESIHFAFHAREMDAAWPSLAGAGEPLALANPLSERYAVLRRSLVPNLVEAAEFNARRGADGVRLLEIGHLFPGADEPELDALAAVAGGTLGGPWDGGAPVDLFRFKGWLEALLAELGVAGLEVRPEDLPGLLPGTAGSWLDGEGERLGWFGRVARCETPFDLFAGELLLERLPRPGGALRVSAPPRLPGVRADLTLTHPTDLPWRELEAAIRALQVEPLRGFRLKERYQGAGVPDGAVATTITFEYNAGERSLTQEEVNQRQSALAAELERRFGVARGGAR